MNNHIQEKSKNELNDGSLLGTLYQELNKMFVLTNKEKNEQTTIFDEIKYLSIGLDANVLDSSERILYWLLDTILQNQRKIEEHKVILELDQEILACVRKELHLSLSSQNSDAKTIARIRKTFYLDQQNLAQTTQAIKFYTSQMNNSIEMVELFQDIINLNKMQPAWKKELGIL